MDGLYSAMNLIGEIFDKIMALFQAIKLTNWLTFYEIFIAFLAFSVIIAVIKISIGLDPGDAEKDKGKK